jgi:serine/threonine protein kinase
MICISCGSQNEDKETTCSACGCALVDTTPGVQLLPSGSGLAKGVYRVGRMIGQGAFGIIYQGSEVRAHRLVAIKEFYPDIAVCHRQNLTVIPGKGTSLEWDKAKQRFVSEAESLKKLSHPGIVSVYESFEENNTAYIVMEFIPGQTLDKILADRRTIAETEAIDWIKQAGEALHALHQANLLHRDLKPANMMYAANRGVVLIDFGSAREFSSVLSKSTSRDLTVGFAPPEQHRLGTILGAYSDIYAFGATLYCLLTGVTPVSSEQRVLGVDLEPPMKLEPSVSKTTNDAILWSMEIRAADRPQDVLEFLKALGGQVVPVRKVPQPPNIVPPSTRLSFQKASASTLNELVDLCDRYPDEAQDYLFNGYIEKWLAQTGVAALAQTARNMTRSYGSAKRKGLELFVREVCKVAQIAPWPVLVSSSPGLDLGRVPIGYRSASQIRLKNQGRGYAWGKVAIQPPIGGITTSATFDGSYSQIEVSLDLAQVSAGSYRAELLVQPDGVPSVLKVPIQLEVLPLRVRVSPESCNLGRLSFGTKTQIEVKLTNSDPGGRIVGQASLTPTIRGAACTTKIDGESPSISVSIDTGTIETGKHCSLTLQMNTNGGIFKVPINFSTSIPWATVWGWTFGCAAGGGAALAALREVVASLQHSQGTWVLGYGAASPELLVATGTLSAVVAVVMIVGYYARRKKKA